MKKLSNVTYLTILGRENPVPHENHEVINRIVKLASNWFEFGAVKLLSAQSKEQCPLNDQIEYVNIKPMDQIEYNRFCVEDLHKYVDTDYVILFQTDGFILNGELWNDDFLKYDYIGSPWPFVYNTHTECYEFIDSIFHKYPKDFRIDYLCGNGGFCLRSKKFLKLSSELKYKPEHEYYDFNPEDDFLCVQNRRYFLENDCKFSEPVIGASFSYENDLFHLEEGEIKEIPLDPNQSLGFHGVHQKNETLFTRLIKRLLYNQI